MHKSFFLVLISFLCFPAIAQKYELGKVTIEELEEKVCPIDTSAIASILFSVGNVQFEFNENEDLVSYTTVKTKIKIYKKEGYDWANKTVRYYIGGKKKESVAFKNEVTYNLVNGRIEKTKIKSDGEFDEKVNDFWGRRKIVMPDVKQGSVVEFEYTLTSENLSFIDKWDFQSTIPVLFSEYKLFIPEYFIYKPAIKGFITPVIYKNQNQKIFTTVTNVRYSSMTLTQTVGQKNEYSYIENQINYSLKNIPALKEEPYVNNINNYIVSVEHELESIQYPNQANENFATDWESVVKRIYKNDDFGNELNKTGYFDENVDVILAQTTADEEKIAVIFNHVKSTMNWNNNYGYYCNEGVRKAYQSKTGNIAEINLMLTSMLRYAGFNSNPILISSRGNGIPLFSSRNAFDSVICGVELNDGIILLDATNKHAMPNILPIRDLNWFGRLIRKDESSEQINLMPAFSSKLMFNLLVEISSEGKIIGKGRDQYLDYNAIVYRDNYDGLNNDMRIEKIEKSYPGIEISKLEVVNSEDLSIPIVENYSFSSNNQVEIIGDKMYFSPLLHLATKENPFRQENRLYPIDFVFPQQQKFNVSITIPEGYAIEALPASKTVGMTDNKAVYKFAITSIGNQIQMAYTYDVNTATIGSEDYEEIKAFYKDMVEKNTEKVVLVKK